MRFLISLACAITIVSLSYAQQPFEKYGYKVKVATLSGGKYEEFFDQDTLIQIGSVVLNTMTGRITHFVTFDTVYSESSLQPELISRWISPDPLADKYTGLSPYNFVANNPILFTDPDGRDFGIYIDHDKKTITIRADFIGTSNSSKSLNQAASFWNSQSGKNVYVVGKGKEAVSYAVNFDVKVQVDDSTPGSRPDGSQYTSKGEERTMADPEANKGELNSFDVLPDSDPHFAQRESGTETSGASNGKNAFVKNSSKNSSTIGAHEVGHNLGMPDTSGGVMGGVNAAGGATPADIAQSLSKVGIGTTQSEGRGGAGTMNGSVGTAPANFSAGSVMTINKYERIQKRAQN